MSVSCANPTFFARKPAAVLFDTDNTLYSYNPAHEQAMRAVVDKAKRVLGIDEDTFHEAFEEARRIIKARLEGTAASHSRLLYMQQTLELLNLRTQLYLALDFEQAYWRTFLSSATLFSGVKEFVLALRRAGVATAVITDLTTQIQFRKLIYFGLNDCFDFVVTSEEAGAEKPAAAPFELTLAKLGVAPEDAIMIGDNPIADIGGAKKLGFVTAQKRHAGVEIAAKPKPDIVFDEFPELGRFLAGQGWLETPDKKKAAKKS